jgi:lysine-N-methylase
MSRFACLGPTCPDHCCKDWQIVIDPATARRYRSMPDSELKQRILSSLTEVKNKDGKRQTRIELTPDGLCPMFGEDGLCGIHASVGEEYLSNICASFPRLLTGTMEHGFRAGTVACCEVAREVLEAPDALQEVSPATASGWQPTAHAKARKGASAKGPVLSLDEAAMVRGAMLKILTTTGQPWLGRITLATLFCNDLSRIDLVRDRGALTPLVLQMHEVVDRADLREIAAADTGEQVLLDAFITMLRIVTTPGTWPAKKGSRGGELVQSAMAALQQNGTELDAVTRTFSQVHRTILLPALDARPHLRGNLLANFLLQKAFPYGRPSRARRWLWDAALSLTLWRVLLVGRLAEDATTFDGTALDVTYLVGRLFMHHPQLSDLLYKPMEERGHADDATLIALLR